MIPLFFQRETWDESKDASIFGAELKNGKQLCVNYFKRRDLYEKRIIFTVLNRQMSFQTHKTVPVALVFPDPTKKLVIVWVALGTNRPFHIKLSLGTSIPSHFRPNNL